MLDREIKLDKSKEWSSIKWLKSIKEIIKTNQIKAIPACLAEIKNQPERIENISNEMKISTEGKSSAEAFHNILTILSEKFDASIKIQALFVREGMSANNNHLRHAISQLDVDLVRLIIKNSASAIQDNPLDGLNYSFYSHPYVGKPIVASQRRLQIAKDLIEQLPPSRLAAQNDSINDVLRLCAAYCDPSSLEDTALIKLLATHTDCFVALGEPNTGKYIDLLLREICIKQENNPSPNFRKKVENALDSKRFMHITDLALFKHLLALMGGLTLKKFQGHYPIEQTLKDKPDFLQAIHDANKPKDKVIETPKALPASPVRTESKKDESAKLTLRVNELVNRLIADLDKRPTHRIFGLFAMPNLVLHARLREYLEIISHSKIKLDELAARLNDYKNEIIRSGDKKSLIHFKACLGLPESFDFRHQEITESWLNGLFKQTMRKSPQR